MNTSTPIRRNIVAIALVTATVLSLLVSSPTFASCAVGVTCPTGG